MILGEVVKSPLAFLQKSGEAGLGKTVEFVHKPLGLIPEILDGIDVRLPICKQLDVVDSVAREGGDIQHVIRAKGVFNKRCYPRRLHN